MSGELGFFEGSEKLLEIWWYTPPQLTGAAAEGRSDLRSISSRILTVRAQQHVFKLTEFSSKREKIEEILDLAACKVISVIKNDEITAYLLSESSLYISSRRLILKTCGMTPLLRAMITILKVAKEECGLTKVKNVFYSHKSFSQPHLQISPHQNFQQEVSVLEQHFPGGSAYTLGKQNDGNCWHLFTIDNITDGLQIADQTLEILMDDLDSNILKKYYKGYYSDSNELTKKEGIADLIPGMTIDHVMFNPCGYSVNGISKDSYFTIHVTPQADFSYASFETNVKYSSFKTLTESVLEIFKPGRFITTLFRNSIAPCGKSLRSFEQEFTEYKRKDLHFACFKNYNLTYAYYEQCC